MKKIFLKISLIGLSLVLLTAVHIGAQAAGPQAFITWKTKGYAPTNYAGKILPGSNSPILANVEVFSGGKVANLSNLTIYWYLNDRLLDRGVGLQASSFRTPQSINGGTITLRVEIPDYPGGGITASINIPLVTPSVVLWSPYPKDKFSSQSVQVRVLPYFFTVPDISFLTFAWNVNGKDVQTTENPQELQVNIAQGAAPGSSLDIKVSVSNPAGYFESSSDEKSLLFSL
jgi:hypothetical protein